jgi:hypothetical protein
MNSKELLPQDVKVDLVDFNQLSNTESPLALDNYQRAYVWGEDKIIQLLTDLSEFMQIKGKYNQYYMGTILLHQKTEGSKSKHFVIDGQQRLTSLAVLYWLLKKKLPAHIQFEFRSSHSMFNIQQAKQTMQTWFESNSFDKNDLMNIFEQLRFTIITVTSEDLAFTFFDTQNNRGVPLGSTDLLKAFHLRAINSNDSELDEKLQSHCASRWESVQLSGNRNDDNKKYDFAPELFHYYLWRSRNWIGNEVVELESKDEMFNHFGELTKTNISGEVNLYPAAKNQWGQTLRLTQSNNFCLTPSPQQFGAQASSLPFALRQPISKGVGFFLYAEKYAAMLNILFHTPSSDPEIKATQAFYKDVISTLSHYLQSLFRLSILTYFDRLGSQGLLNFSLCLDHRLGAIRLSQADVRRETPLKFLRDAKRNLLDVIAYAYDSDDVIKFLAQSDVSKIYKLKNGWVEEIKQGNLVQARYAAAVAKYYKLDRLNIKTPETIDRLTKQQLSVLNNKNKEVIND